MRSISNGSIIMFLNDMGINPNPVGPQIRDFDVFYTEQPLVGIHLYGISEPDIAAFYIEEVRDTILYFSVADIKEIPPPEPILFLLVADEEKPDSILFFNVSEEPGREADETILFFNIVEVRCG